MKHKFVPSILTSDRLRIRPHKKGDEILLNKAVTDSFEQLHEWMDWATTPQTLQESKAYINVSQKFWADKDPVELPFLIFDPQEKKLYGAITLNNINWKIPSFEIGYWANIHYARNGYITEAVNILMQYAFSTWKAKRIEIYCDPENTKSAAIAKKLGFIQEAHFKNHRIHPATQTVADTLVFARYDPLGLPKTTFKSSF